MEFSGCAAAAAPVVRRVRDENKNGNFRFSRIFFEILSTFKVKTKMKTIIEDTKTKMVK